MGGGQGPAKWGALYPRRGRRLKARRVELVGARRAGCPGVRVLLTAFAHLVVVAPSARGSSTPHPSTHAVRHLEWTLARGGSSGPESLRARAAGLPPAPCVLSPSEWPWHLVAVPCPRVRVSRCLSFPFVRPAASAVSMSPDVSALAPPFLLGVPGGCTRVLGGASRFHEQWHRSRTGGASTPVLPSSVRPSARPRRGPLRWGWHGDRVQPLPP